MQLRIDKHKIRIDVLGTNIPYSKPGGAVRCIKHGGSNNINLSPIQPSNPTPPHNATDISINQSLSWFCTDPEGDPITYDIYFGTNNNPELVASNQSSKTFYPGSLITWTKYYWKIVASDNNGNSNSGPIWEFTTKESSTSGSVCLGANNTVTYEGKVYNTVLIGSQCWLKENLDIGTMITSDGPEDYQTNNGVIEKFCYDNDAANCETYGGLYQWNEAMQYNSTEGTQGVCPDGWHIPTESEFITLLNTVENDGNALKEIGQGSGDGEGTNISGFSALLSGNNYDSFVNLSYITNFWSSSIKESKGIFIQLAFNHNHVSSNVQYNSDGNSIRCLED